MLAIIFQTIKSKKISLISYSLGALLFLWMFVSMFPSIQEQSEKFAEVFSSYPEQFFSIFNIEELQFDTLEKFLAIEHYSILWPILALFLMVSIAGVGLSGEIEKGTMSLVLARPVSRLKIFAARYIAGLMMLVIFTLFSVFAVIPLSALHNVDYSLESQLAVSLLGFLFGWAVFSLAYMFSAVFSEKSKTYMLMGGVLVGMYALNIAANLKENWEDLNFFTFFHYFNYNKALLDAGIGRDTLFVFIATIVISTVCGALIFHKRDIAI